MEAARRLVPQAAVGALVGTPLDRDAGVGGLSYGAGLAWVDRVGLQRPTLSSI